MGILAAMYDRDCKKCHGSGQYYYPNTGTFYARRGDLVGHAFAWDVCDECWGSGSESQPFRNIKELWISYQHAEHKLEKYEQEEGAWGK